MRASAKLIALCAALVLVVPVNSLGQGTSQSPPVDCAWLQRDGIRAAWLSYKQITDEMVPYLLDARVNTILLKHGFHDLLDLDTARWQDGRVVVSPRTVVLERILASTQRAADAGIHVIWIANYELRIMLPHLERLGYEPANTEGPYRFVKSGPKQDAAALDRVFWLGITGAHGELIARESLQHPIAGVMYDTEHYDGGIMYLQNCGFADSTFADYHASREIVKPLAEIPAGERYAFLSRTGRLADYYNYLEERAWQQGRALAERWHAVNPHLMLGTWPLLDNWFSRGMLRGFGDAVPALGLSGVEYYEGAEQTRSLADYFERRDPNLFYMAGFYPPFAYTPDQLRDHVAVALRDTGRYWMLGPHKELGEESYRRGLRAAYERSVPWGEAARATVAVGYDVIHHDGAPVLVVTAESDDPPSSPPFELSLYSAFGGAPLCERSPMQRRDDGTHVAQVPLVRRLTNNRFLSDGFRSGATYQFEPVPREWMYEDVDHTKLIDGRAYGYFGSSVAWRKSLDKASAVFDLHRSYRVTRVEVSQPTKMEDRIGGPTHLELFTAAGHDDWESAGQFRGQFDIAARDVSEPDDNKPDDNKPDPAAENINDPRHKRGWLSWHVEDVDRNVRRLRIDLTRARGNSSLSLGEVVIWGRFNGELEAVIGTDDQSVEITSGRRYRVE